ncbi:EamA family transporter [Ciceribacter sp. RN22]
MPRANAVAMEFWAAVTITSAFLQNVRSALQKHLKGRMGTTGATFVRFGFGVPFALVYLGILHFGLGRPLPAPNAGFWFWAVVGAFAQIAATFLLVHLFSFRNFAVGTAYSRTEPAQAALLALVFFGERISGSVMIAIAVSVVGVVLISVARTELAARTLLRAVVSRTALVGLLSGLFFGVSGIAYRAASLSLAPSLPAPDSMMQAGYTLVMVILMQAFSMFVWMALRDREELRRVGKAAPVALLVGFVGATASFGWFTAMTLQQVAVVKALAQIEMLFTFASSVFIFRERITVLEFAGCLFVVLGVLILVLG